MAEDLLLRKQGNRLSFRADQFPSLVEWKVLFCFSNRGFVPAAPGCGQFQTEGKGRG